MVGLEDGAGQGRGRHGGLAERGLEASGHGDGEEEDHLHDEDLRDHALGPGGSDYYCIRDVHAWVVYVVCMGRSINKAGFRNLRAARRYRRKMKPSSFVLRIYIAQFCRGQLVPTYTIKIEAKYSSKV